MDSNSNNNSVVVGVDGSPGSRTALDYAIDEARRRQARLRVVAAVQLPQHWATAYGMPRPPAPSEIAADVKAAAQRMIDTVKAGRPDVAGIPIDLVTRVGTPGDVLVEEARGADLLVVGHRGRGRFVSAVIGSVGMDCILNATCPVTVVRPEHPRGEARAAADAASAQA
jgi:nucleotide-binding universal stress UspA family protein